MQRAGDKDGKWWGFIICFAFCGFLFMGNAYISVDECVCMCVQVYTYRLTF